jgi:phasin family protein
MNEQSAAFAAPFKPLLTSLTRLNQFAVGRMEHWVALQMDSLRAYVDLGVAQTRVALKVTSPHSLHEFADSQFAVLSFVGHRVIDDRRAMSEWGNEGQKQAIGLSRVNLLTTIFKD